MIGLTGCVRFNYHQNKLLEMAGKMDRDEVILIAIHLLKWGIVGDPKSRKKSKGGSVREFDATEYIGSAVAHLGIDPATAWLMTMTEFQRAVEAKDPDITKEKEIPTGAEVDAALDHAQAASDKVNKILAEKAKQ